MTDLFRQNYFSVMKPISDKLFEEIFDFWQEILVYVNKMNQEKTCLEHYQNHYEMKIEHLEINKVSLKSKVRCRSVVEHLVNSCGPIFNVIILFDLAISNAVNTQVHGFKPLSEEFLSRNTRQE